MRRNNVVSFPVDNDQDAAFQCSYTSSQTISSLLKTIRDLSETVNRQSRDVERLNWELRNRGTLFLCDREGGVS